MRQQRLARLAYAMQERGITQVIISEDRNLYYYLGQYEESMERLRILLVDDRGGCRCYANELFDIPADSSIEVIRHSDGDESRALRELAENLVRGGQIAVDKEWPSGFLLELIAFAGNRKFIPAGELLRAPMICKDETEQILMRESCRINDLVMEALLSSIDESSTEAGLSRSVHALYDRYGAQGTAGGALVAFGKNCANAHPKSKEICPQMGNCILIDMGAPYCYYQSDMTSTVFFRDVNQEMEKIYSIVLEANLAGIDAVRPGRPAMDVDSACRQVIEKSGYGLFFTHRTGHGIGLHLHEEPYIQTRSPLILEEGMIFSIEPGIYLPGKGGVRIEDLVIVTAHGAEVLSCAPKDLQVLQ